MPKIVSVTKIFKFEMAHQLNGCYSQECKNIHGHGYKLEITFSGPLNEDGMVMDFKLVKEIVQPIVDHFDHSFQTTETLGYNPTAENMADDIFKQIRKKCVLLKSIRLWETDTCFIDVSY